jgi:hypothetical protein
MNDRKWMSSISGRERTMTAIVTDFVREKYTHTYTLVLFISEFSSSKSE